MKTPNVGDVVTVVIGGSGVVVRATVAKSYKRRFIAAIDPESISSRLHPYSFSYERGEEGRRWVRGWDTEDAVAWRAEFALASCR